MKILLCFFYILICCGFKLNYFPSKFYTEYEKIADEITMRTAKKLNREKGFILFGIGGGMMDDIKLMSVSFELDQVVDLKTARELLIESVNEYLYEINTDERVRPYLHNYPFTAENICIKIFFNNTDGSTIALNELAIASAYEGRVSYTIRCAQKPGFMEIHEETFEEAVQACLSE